MPSAERRIVILISGRGSNMEAIVNACKSGSLNGTVAAVISNRPDAKGLSTASAAGIETKAIDHKAYESRDSFDRALAEAIDSYRPDVLVLAGFMRILTETFVAKFLGKMINVHPSLLPDYPGLNTHQRAIDNGDDEAGATVHYVTGELDGGLQFYKAESLSAKTIQQTRSPLEFYPPSIKCWSLQSRGISMAVSCMVTPVPFWTTHYSHFAVSTGVLWHEATQRHYKDHKGDSGAHCADKPVVVANHSAS